MYNKAELNLFNSALYLKIINKDYLIMTNFRLPHRSLVEQLEYEVLQVA